MGADHSILQSIVRSMSSGRLRNVARLCSEQLEQAIQKRDAGQPIDPFQVRREAAQHGLCSLDLPSPFGAAFSFQEMGELFAGLGYLDADFRDVAGAGHGALLALEPRGHEELLGQVATGTAYIAVCITESSGGSDLHGIRTTATPVADEFCLSGEKAFNARLQRATHALVFAVSNRIGQPGEPALSVYVVPLAAQGVEVRTISTPVLPGTPLGRVKFERVTVPRSARVGGEGQGFSLFQQHFAYWRAATAAVAVGVGRAALSDTKEWILSRHAFGGPIVRFSHLQQEYATHAARLHMAWLLVQSTMARIDKKLPAWTDAAMAKVEAVEAALGAVRWAMRVAGARGVATGYSSHMKRQLDLNGLEIADGTPDVLRGAVARSLLGDDAYELSLGTSRRVDGRGQQIHRRLW